MIKTTLDRSGIVINRAEEECTLEDIYDYLVLHVHEWIDRAVLWDLTCLDFSRFGPQSARIFIEKNRQLLKKRSKQKTAILVNSDLGFGLSRKYETLSEDLIQVAYRVFKDTEEALNWLKE